MKNDYCDECEGKPGGHKPYCSKRFEMKDNLTEENARIRVQLIVAGIACLMVMAGILWQVFGGHPN